MSLLSTIAYDGTHDTREIPFKGFGLVVAALVLGAAIGFVIADNPPATDTPVAAATGMALDDFIRLNTTSYEGLVPVSAAAAVEAQRVGDAFLDMNIASYEGLTPVKAPVDPFLEMNIASYEGLAPMTPAVATAQAVSDQFLTMNIASYEGLAPMTAPAIAAQRVVDSDFLYWNTVALEGLTPRSVDIVNLSPQVVDDGFWHLNVTSLEYPEGRYTEQPSGPR